MDPHNRITLLGVVCIVGVIVHGGLARADVGSGTEAPGAGNGIFIAPEWAGPISDEAMIGMLDDAASHGLGTIYITVYRTIGVAEGHLTCADDAGWNPDWGPVLAYYHFDTLIAAAHARNIRVIANVTCFSPEALPSSAEHRAFLLTTIIPHLMAARATVWPFDGVSLDYVRYFGAPAESAVVTAFVGDVRAACGDTPLSAFVLAYPWALDAAGDGQIDGVFSSRAQVRDYLATNYGQDWAALAAHLDVVHPMLYAGGEADVYGVDEAKIAAYVATGTRYCREAVSGHACRVVPAVKTWAEPGAVSTDATVKASLAGVASGDGEGFLAFRYFGHLSIHPSWMDVLSKYSNLGNELPAGGVSGGGFYQEGDRLLLRVESMPGDATGYQWTKDGASISGATSSDYEVASLTEADSGSYTCMIVDERKALYETEPALVHVFPVGELALMSPLGFRTLALICIFAGLGAAYCVPRPRACH
jgi:hypothetical protein